MRCLLLFDVLAHDADGCASTRRCEVRRRPQHALPVPSLDVGPVFAQQAAGDALEAIHQRGHGDLGRVLDQKVHVIVLPVHLDQGCLEVHTDLGEHATQAFDGIAIEHAAPVLGHKDQVHVHSEYTVSAVPDVVVVAHRPKYALTMKRLQAFKFELMPNGEQIRAMRQFAGACRYVFNKALAEQKARRERGEKHLGRTDLCKLITAWRNDSATAWLADAPVHPLQQSLKDLQAAYSNFFAKRADFPCFKKKGKHASFRYPDPKQFKIEQGNDRLFLPKLGWLRYRNSREILGSVKNITVSQDHGKWFVSLQTEREVERPVPQGEAIGVDVGIARFATFSDGRFIEPLNSGRRHQGALRKAQRSLSRKTKFSSNWKKAKAKVQRIQARIGNCRKDFLHKATTTISKNHAMVCIEDLQVGNMSKSAAGTVEAPGKQVKAKSGLNRSILDQGWYEFRRQLDYKTAWNGGCLIAVPPHNTSRTCPCCGHVDQANRTSQARFECLSCGYRNHADVVGAINVLERGLRLSACGEAAFLASMKQEPAEATQALAA